MSTLESDEPNHVELESINKQDEEYSQYETDPNQRIEDKASTR